MRLASGLFLSTLAVAGARAGEPSAAVPPPAPPLAAAVPAAAPPGARAAPSALAQPQWQGLINLGGSLTERGDYAAASIAFWQILRGKAVPEDFTKSALLGLARLHRRQGSLTKAAAVYERYLKDYPGDMRAPEALLDLGRTLRSMGAFKLALARFYGVINATLKLPGEGFDRYQLLAKTAQFEIAETHLEAGDYAEARKYFLRLRLLDLAPVDRDRALFKAATAVTMLGDRAQAVDLLREYLELAPAGEDSAEARYRLATHLRALHRPAEAFATTLDLLRDEQRHATADPARWSYWQRRTGNQLANDFFSSGDIAHALTLYTSLAALSAEPAWHLPVVYQIGLCRERLGADDQARECYRTIVATAPSPSSPELAELTRAARWRLTQLDWRSHLQQEVHVLFDTKTGQPPPATPTPPVPSPAS